MTSMANEAGLHRWGRHREDDLLGVCLATVTVVQWGPAFVSPRSLCSRETPWRLFLRRRDAEGFVLERNGPEEMFLLREVPALRFATTHGSVLVADVWDDTLFRTLHGAQAFAALALRAPLMAAADRIAALSTRRPGGRSPELAAHPIGWQHAEPFSPQLGLSAWVTDVHPRTGERSWVRARARYTVRAVHEVITTHHAANDPEELRRAAEEYVTLQRAARHERRVGGGIGAFAQSTIDQGIADLELLANGR